MQKEYFNMGRNSLTLTYTGLPPATTSLTPNPSPNGEGSDDYCLQIKGAFRWCEERLSS